MLNKDIVLRGEGFGRQFFTIWPEKENDFLVMLHQEMQFLIAYIYSYVPSMYGRIYNEKTFFAHLIESINF